MILVCPSCSARYLVPASAFANGPRTVRCAQCSHQWEADTPPSITVLHPPITPESPPLGHVVSSAPVAAPATATSAGTSVPAVRQSTWLILLRHYGLAVLAGTLLLVFIILLALGNYSLPVPPMTLPEPVKAALKQTAAIASLQNGLVLQNVRSERRLDNAMMVLDIAGEIVNNGQETTRVPQLKAIALSPNGESIQSWPIVAPVATLDPGGRASFQSSFDLPQASVSEISLRFSGIKDDE